GPAPGLLRDRAVRVVDSDTRARVAGCVDCLAATRLVAVLVVTTVFFLLSDDRGTVMARSPRRERWHPRRACPGPVSVQAPTLLLRNRSWTSERLASRRWLQQQLAAAA